MEFQKLPRHSRGPKLSQFSLSSISLYTFVPYTRMLLVKSIACLALLSSTAVASNFFVHEDVLAHPLYSIQLGTAPIANSSAQRILEQEQAHSRNDQTSHQELQKNNHDKEKYVCIRTSTATI